MEKDKRSMIIRFAIVYFIMVVLFTAAIAKLIHTQTHESKTWIHKSDSIRNAYKVINVEPKRGNIYSYDGRLLASDMIQYGLYMDFGKNEEFELRKNNGKLFFDNLDSLSYCLANELKDKTKEEYKTHLLKGYNTNRRYYLITTKKISHLTSKKIRNFPLFREKKADSWLRLEAHMKREHPFEPLAVSTIGNFDNTGKPQRGLEHFFDSTLAGKTGKAHYEDIAGASIRVVDNPAIDGTDITTTLDVIIQDFADKALRKKLIELNADSGVVILMEVKTGQVKACVNLTRKGGGIYSEINNIALTAAVEPGSTFKAPAMMAALEDKKISPTDIVDCGDGIWHFNSTFSLSDHNTGANANGKIPASEAIVRSSNVAMGKIIYNGYKNNPQQYVETLRKMGVGEAMNFEFTGGGVKASILGPKEKNNWSASDLPSMGIGYAIEMPLLYTLAFYNAIANDGKMLQPYFVKNIGKNKDIQAKVIRESIASQETLDAIKEMMLGVVEGSKGTGKPVKSDFVQIAGKTGTARYAKDKETGKYKHRITFCGFFPYDNPQYSCIVFIQNPKKGEASGGGMAGVVFKEIAEKVMAHKSNISIKTMPKDSMRTIMPRVKNGNYDATRLVLNRLKVKTTDNENPDVWIKAQSDNASVILSPLKITDNLVPDVEGMGARDAVYVLENAGLQVQLSGRGKVVSQTIQPGTKISKGNTILLTLN